MLLLVATALAGTYLDALPPGTTLLRTEEHPEYVRLFLHTDRDFVVELTPSRPGATPVCQAAGVDLFVRLDVSRPTESFVWDPYPEVVTRLCAGLTTHAPTFAPSTPRVGDLPPLDPAAGATPEGTDAAGEPVAPAEPANSGMPGLSPSGPVAAGPRWVAVTVLAAATMLFTLAGVALAERPARLLFVGTLAVRLALTPRTVILGGDAAYERLLSAATERGHDAYYGDGFVAVVAPFVRAFGDPGLLHVVDLTLSSLAPAWAWILARAWGRSRSEALGAGVVVAAVPVLTVLAGMEDAFVLVALLQLVSVAGAGLSWSPVPERRRWRAPLGAWTAACAAALLAHTRPEQAVFTLVPFGLLALHRRWLPLAVGLVAAAARWGEVATAGTGVLRHGTSLLQLSALAEPPFWLRFLTPGPGSGWIGVDPRVVPIAVPVLAVWGLRRAPRFGGVVLLAGGAGLLPVAAKLWPLADRLRFQLPSAHWLALLAGVGLVGLRGRTRALGVLALAVTAVLARDPLAGGWAWQEEYTWLRRALPGLDAGTTVFLDATQDPNGVFRSWVAHVAPIHPRAWGSGSPAPGDLVYCGTADRIGAAADVGAPQRGGACPLEPLDVTEVPPASDGWVEFGPEPIRLGLYRVTGPCATGGVP